MNEIAPLAIVTPAPVSAVAVVRMPAEFAGMAAGTILTGIVVGREPGGHTVIRTQYGALTLKGGALPMGGAVTLQLQQTGAQIQVVLLSVSGGNHAAREAPATFGASQLPPPGTTEAESGDVVRMLTGHWDALAEGLRAAPGLARLVPWPGPEFAAAALMLIASLKRGTLTEWLGDEEEMRTLPAPLIRHLGEDFARMARLADADPAAWRFIPIPLLREGVLEQALLFARGGHRDGAIRDDSATRLLVEIEHARLGRLQIDALVRPHRFDLIVRSHAELPLPLRGRLAAIHSEARDIAGLAGTIGFQWSGAFVAPPLAVDHLGLTA